MQEIYHLDDIKKIILVASAKGGVGKSTVAINIATALSQLKYNVGILDADIYGPSIPKMLNLKEKPKISKDNRFIPLEKFNMKCMSIGFLVDQKTPLIWRGPMIIKALKQMLHGVVWTGVDILVVDLPPGTYTFKFRNGFCATWNFCGQWQWEDFEGECGVGEWGDREITVVDEGFSYGAYCFDFCEEGECPLIAPVDVTFQVEVSDDQMSDAMGNGMFMYGNFNGYDYLFNPG